MDKVFWFVSDSHTRLDVFLALHLENTRSNLQQLIRQGNCTVNDTVVTKPSFALFPNCAVQLTVPPPVTQDTIKPQDIDIKIIYQDSDIAIIDKPQGLVVHPSPNMLKDTLVNALMQKLDSLSGINGQLRPGIVHRLDKETSGVMVVAKNDKAHTHLSRQFADRTVKKKYLGVVQGIPKSSSATINAPIGRHKQDRKKMAIVTGGRHATTKYTVVQQFLQTALLEFDLLTGRTHQIRVHCKHIGHPIVGDAIYGNIKLCTHQLLHAQTLAFLHPITGEALKFYSPTPDYFADFLQKQETYDKATVD